MNYSVIKNVTSLFRDNINSFFNLIYLTMIFIWTMIYLVLINVWGYTGLGVTEEVGPRIFPHQIQEIDFYLPFLITGTFMYSP